MDPSNKPPLISLLPGPWQLTLRIDHVSRGFVLANFVEAFWLGGHIGIYLGFVQAGRGVSVGWGVCWGGKYFQLNEIGPMLPQPLKKLGVQ